MATISIASCYANSGEISNMNITNLLANSINIPSTSSVLSISGSSILQQVTISDLSTSKTTLSTLSVTSSVLQTITMSDLKISSNTAVKGSNSIFYLIPAFAASGSVSNQTTKTTIFSFSVPAVDTAYIVSGYVDMSSYTSGSGLLRVFFTSPGLNSRTTNSFIGTLWPNGVPGNTQTINSTGTFTIYSTMIYAKANTEFGIIMDGTFVMTYSGKFAAKSISI